MRTQVKRGAQRLRTQVRKVRSECAPYGGGAVGVVGGAVVGVVLGATAGFGYFWQ